jgi:Ni,Fe-hydrogenase III small subunit
MSETKHLEESMEVFGQKLGTKIKRLFGRSLGIREVDAGSCNACEVEATALGYPFYDMERFGIHVVASPRHADILLVTGPITRNMQLGLMQSYKATPTPKIVIAMGSCAISGGIFKDSYAVGNGADNFVPVDVYIPGCPPRPQAIMHGIMVALDKFESKMTGAPVKP